MAPDRAPRQVCTVDKCKRLVWRSDQSYCRMHNSILVEGIWRGREIKHGTHNEYANYGCRCSECKAAMSEYNRQKLLGVCSRCGQEAWNNRAPRLQSVCKKCSVEIRAEEHPIRHGTTTGYARGCRCNECRKASADDRRKRRHAEQERDPEGYRQRERERRQAWRRKKKGLPAPVSLVDLIMADVEEVLSTQEKKPIMERLDDEDDPGQVIPELEELFRKPSVFVPSPYKVPSNGHGLPAEIPSFESRGEGKNLIEVVHQLLKGEE